MAHIKQANSGLWSPESTHEKIDSQKMFVDNMKQHEANYVDLIKRIHTKVDSINELKALDVSSEGSIVAVGTLVLVIGIGIYYYTTEEPSDKPDDKEIISVNTGWWILTCGRGSGGSLIVSDEWDSLTVYDIGDYVIYNNTLWKCLVQNNGQIPTDGTYWSKCSVANEISSLNAELSNLTLIFNNISVSATSWISDATYANYPYKADIPCDGVTKEYVADVILGVTEVASDNFAPITLTGEGIVTIYAKEVPESDIVIPTIKCVKMVSGSGGTVESGIVIGKVAVDEEFSIVSRNPLMNKTSTKKFEEVDTTLSSHTEAISSLNTELSNLSTSVSNTTTFNDDGSITTTYEDGRSERTTFNDDGSIITTSYFEGAVSKVETITFNVDGSITITYE